MSDKKQQDEELDGELEDTFPASDPPSITDPNREVGTPQPDKQPEPGKK